MRERLLMTVLEAIANREGTSPEQLDYSLQEYVEADALRLLEEHDSESWTFSFEVPDHTVTVSGDGTIAVDGEPVKHQAC